MAEAQPRGECRFCGVVMAKGGMARHVVTCPRRREAIERADAAGGKRETLLLLRVEDQWRKEYWLDLEMRGSAVLGELDHYLRVVWLECCGHLSQFMETGWGSREFEMDRRAAKVLDEGRRITHLYDFGTTSHTIVRVLRVRQGVPLTEHPIVLLARNLPPEAACARCGEPATHLCRECAEMVAEPYLCRRHARTHGHRSYGRAVRLVNSPRLGLCGYDGPAKPPY